MSSRSAGILLHPTSLPGRFGIGDLGPQAVRFLEWLEAAGQTLWQILPLGPPGEGNTPYTALSAFAGDPRLVSPEILERDGLLPAARLDDVPGLASDRVEFARVRRLKAGLLHAAWERFRTAPTIETKRRFEAFVEDSAQGAWLEDWTLYASLKARYRGASWIDWDPALARREPASLAAARSELVDEIAYHRFEQFLFFDQWSALRSEASARGIRILGDVPIYVAEDSADVWSRPDLFDLDECGRPVHVAGVPPDYFSETGQLWGNPLYRWDRLEEEGFRWWIDRMRANLRTADLVRLDHFRAFAAYWAVPASAETAENGAWLPGPKDKLLAALRDALGGLPLVAEDLGTITPDVLALRDAFDLPGMKVLQFAFHEDDSTHHPRHHAPPYVVYTGTHDNDTTRGWFATLPEDARLRALRDLGGDGGDIAWRMIGAAYASPAAAAVVPMQDVLDLGTEARMNTPGKARGNWEWRMREEPGAEIAARLRSLSESTGRLRTAGAAPRDASPSS
jgi:4-alpha-glucanotransferase